MGNRGTAEGWEMSVYEVLSLLLETCILTILVAEYFWGRSDTNMKNEARRKRKFKEKYSFEHITAGEGK